MIPNTAEARQQIRDKIEFKRLASRIRSLVNRLPLDEVREIEATLTQRVKERENQDKSL